MIHGSTGKVSLLKCQMENQQGVCYRWSDALLLEGAGLWALFFHLYFSLFISSFTQRGLGLPFGHMCLSPSDLDEAQTCSGMCWLFHAVCRMDSCPPLPWSTVSVQWLGEGLWRWGQVGLKGRVIFLPASSLLSVQDRWNAVPTTHLLMQLLKSYTKPIRLRLKRMCVCVGGIPCFVIWTGLNPPALNTPTSTFLCAEIIGRYHGTQVNDLQLNLFILGLPSFPTCPSLVLGFLKRER